MIWNATGGGIGHQWQSNGKQPTNQPTEFNWQMPPLQTDNDDDGHMWLCMPGVWNSSRTTSYIIWNNNLINKWLIIFSQRSAFNISFMFWTLCRRTLIVIATAIVHRHSFPSHCLTLIGIANKIQDFRSFYKMAMMFLLPNRLRFGLFVDQLSAAFGDHSFQLQ